MDEMKRCNEAFFELKRQVNVISIIKELHRKNWSAGVITVEGHFLLKS